MRKFPSSPRISLHLPSPPLKRSGRSFSGSSPASRHATTGSTGWPAWAWTRAGALRRLSAETSGPASMSWTCALARAISPCSARGASSPSTRTPARLASPNEAAGGIAPRPDPAVRGGQDSVVRLGSLAYHVPSEQSESRDAPSLGLQPRDPGRGIPSLSEGRAHRKEPWTLPVWLHKPAPW